MSDRVIVTISNGIAEVRFNRPDKRNALDREQFTAIAEAGLTRSGSGTGGSALWMAAPEGVDTADLAARLRAEGVLIEAGRAFFAAEDAPRHYYRLAYSSIPEARIPEGIARIARAIGA